MTRARLLLVYALLNAGPAGAAEKRAVPAARPAAAQPAAKPESNAAKAGIKWVRIPGGTYRMGTDERGWKAAKPVHTVTVKTFEMARSSITYKQYRACVDAGVCTPIHLDDGTCWMKVGDSEWRMGVLPQSFRGDDHPAVCADWFQATTYAKWAGARLPTEAEWEYAARSGGKDWKYPWGDEKATCERAVMDEGKGSGCGTLATLPVCSKPKGNTLQGLCDMAGGNWEWQQDWFHDNYDGAPTDGSAWESPKGVMRSARGGSWDDFHWLVRSSFRNAGYPSDRCAGGTFRLARDVAN